jgi:hypothetical protein
VDSLTGVQSAGLLSEPLSAPSAGAAASTAAKVDQYFAQDEESDDLSVYSSDLADTVLAGSGTSVRRASGDNAADLALDGVVADLAADQGSQGTSADGFFARLGRFFRPQA